MRVGSAAAEAAGLKLTGTGLTLDPLDCGEICVCAGGSARGRKFSALTAGGGAEIIGGCAIEMEVAAEDTPPLFIIAAAERAGLWLWAANTGCCSGGLLGNDGDGSGASIAARVGDDGCKLMDAIVGMSSAGTTGMPASAPGIGVSN